MHCCTVSFWQRHLLICRHTNVLSYSLSIPADTLGKFRLFWQPTRTSMKSSTSVNFSSHTSSLGSRDIKVQNLTRIWAPDVIMYSRMRNSFSHQALISLCNIPAIICHCQNRIHMTYQSKIFITCTVLSTGWIVETGKDNSLSQRKSKLLHIRVFIPSLFAADSCEKILNAVLIKASSANKLEAFV